MVRHCEKCKTTRPVDEFDQKFCRACRLPWGSLLTWDEEGVLRDEKGFPTAACCVAEGTNTSPGTTWRVLGYDEYQKSYRAADAMLLI